MVITKEAWPSTFCRVRIFPPCRKSETGDRKKGTDLFSRDYTRQDCSLPQ